VERKIWMISNVFTVLDQVRGITRELEEFCYNWQATKNMILALHYRELSHIFHQMLFVIQAELEI